MTEANTSQETIDMTIALELARSIVTDLEALHGEYRDTPTKNRATTAVRAARRRAIQKCAHETEYLRLAITDELFAYHQARDN